jgi:3-hydroxymyristoyl/3-hydroxydecanoyl-(acyl carrier protein) dehydratase
MSDLETWINTVKRQPLQIEFEDTVKLNFGKEDIDKIIPHRAPFALITSLTAVSLERQSIEATSYVNPFDPIFDGHFPDMPVYPGVMQIESMGQAGLCMAYFLKNATTEITEESVPVKGLFTRVHNAGFNKAVKPGDLLAIRVQSLEDDDFMGLMMAQVLLNDEVYSHSVLEVYYP